MTQRFSLLLPTNIDTTTLFEMIFLASNRVWQYFCHQFTYWIFLFRVNLSYLEKAFLAVFEICCYWSLLSLSPTLPTMQLFSGLLLLAVFTCTLNLLIILLADFKNRYFPYCILLCFLFRRRVKKPSYTTTFISQVTWRCFGTDLMTYKT